MFNKIQSVNITVTVTNSKFHIGLSYSVFLRSLEIPCDKKNPEDDKLIEF